MSSGNTSSIDLMIDTSFANQLSPKKKVSRFCCLHYLLRQILKFSNVLSAEKLYDLLETNMLKRS